MKLLAETDRRVRADDLWLGGVTAAVAGLVNVCSVIAFFAFSSNVTGHVAVFVEELVKGHWHQLGVVLVWLLLFLGGAGTANHFVHAADEKKRRALRLVPMMIEAILLTGVAFYGSHHYQETLSETEVMVGALLFAMGLQNGLVATVSKGLVKTTHLTGLMTDLGMELSMLLRERFRNDETVRFKFLLHLLIFFGYVGGGMVGGLLFLQVKFLVMYLGAAGLAGIVAHEVLASKVARFMRQVSTPEVALGGE